MFGNLKAKVKAEVSPKPPKTQLAQVVALLIILASFVLGFTVSVYAGVSLFVAGLIFSIYSARKWNF